MYLTNYLSQPFFFLTRHFTGECSSVKGESPSSVGETDLLLNGGYVWRSTTVRVNSRWWNRPINQSVTLQSLSYWTTMTCLYEAS